MWKRKGPRRAKTTLKYKNNNTGGLMLSDFKTSSIGVERQINGTNKALGNKHTHIWLIFNKVQRKFTCERTVFSAIKTAMLGYPYVKNKKRTIYKKQLDDLENWNYKLKLLK